MFLKTSPTGPLIHGLNYFRKRWQIRRDICLLNRTAEKRLSISDVIDTAKPVKIKFCA
jgi:hypothetical protein